MDNGHEARPVFKYIHAKALHGLPQRELLTGTPFVARGLNVIFGPSGAYKSFYMLHNALTIAQTAPVIYVAAEGSSGLDMRVRAWTEKHQREPGDLHFLCEEVNLLDPNHIKTLVIDISKHRKGVGMVIFDTLARCIPGGDENSARDMGIAIRHCAQLQRSLETAITLVHHTNKAETSERGSGAIRGGADLMIEIGNGGEEGLVRVNCSKSKDTEAWPTELYRFVPVGLSGVLLPASEVILSGQLSKSQVLVLDCLALPIFLQHGARSKQIEQHTKIPEGSLWRLLSELKEKGLMVQGKRGDPYFITMEGRHTLAIKMRLDGNSQRANELEAELSDHQMTIN